MRKLTMVSSVVDKKLVTKFIWLTATRDGRFLIDPEFVRRAFRRDRAEILLGGRPKKK